MKTATFIEKEQVWQDEATRYWFDVDGENYAVVESGGMRTIIDKDGYPLTRSQEADQIDRVLVVTDEMRAA